MEYTYYKNMKKTDLFFGFILLPVDIAMVIAAFIAAYYLRIDLEVTPVFSDIGLREYLHYSLYLIPLWIILFAIEGLYYLRASTSLMNEFYKIASASSTAILLLIVEIFLSRSFFFSRLILVFTWILSILFITFGRIAIKLLRRYLYRYGIGRVNILLIGDNKTSADVVSDLSKKPQLGYHVSGILGINSETSKHGLKIIGQTSDIIPIIKKYNIDEIVLTENSMAKNKVLEIIEVCSDYCITFKYIPDIFSLMTAHVSPQLIGSMPVMELKPIPLDGWGRIVKRIIDIVFSAIFLIILSPIFLLIATFVKITSKGPVFYAQERIGRDEKPFRCYKFRSMYVDKCDFTKGGSKWSKESDEKSRITTLGKILRKTNLDELPQLWNIFSGNMSFIGPRPEQPKFVQKFESEIPGYFRRHRVKSGLTGWAQVNGLKGDTSIQERVRYDIYYIENWSLWFDLKIIAKTIALIIYEIFGGKYEYRSSS